MNIENNNQQGGTTAGQVAIGNQQRHLNEQAQQALLPHLPSKEKPINVTSTMGNSESFQYANEIKFFLEKQGYKVSGVDQIVFSQPILGQHIKQMKDDSIKIIIGSIKVGLSTKIG
jgi:hypothetical protein